MEATGVINKVDQPTNWCAGMVVARVHNSTVLSYELLIVVQKKSRRVPICVDVKLLSQNVLREVHPITHVEETLAQLQGGKVFSKLDANSGFWQVPLAKNNHYLTTFISTFWVLLLQ